MITAFLLYANLFSASCSNNHHPSDLSMQSTVNMFSTQAYPLNRTLTRVTRVLVGGPGEWGHSGLEQGASCD